MDRLTASLSFVCLATLTACNGAMTRPAEKSSSITPAAMTMAPTDELIPEIGGATVRPATVEATDDRIAGLKVPAGFKVAKFAGGLGKPRMLAVGSDGTVYVTRREEGDVVALRDADGDGKAESTTSVVKDLPKVHGIAIKGDAMYLATVDAVYSANITGRTVSKPRMILKDLPPGGRHPNRTLAVGDDGLVYITVGSTTNNSVEKDLETATILTIRPDGSDRKIFATGLRNTLGFGWHPKTRVLWGMDHGSDWLGDDTPPEELNELQAGKHYGWPFVYGKGEVIKIPQYPADFNRDAWLGHSTPITLGYTAHAAPLQLAFYDGDAFPAEYRGDAFVAMHGSWNRQAPVGYEVVRITFDDAGRPQSFEPFLTGFLVDGPGCFGRPAGIAVGKDGALLVSDDTNGIIYAVRRL